MTDGRKTLYFLMGGVVILIILRIVESIHVYGAIAEKSFFDSANPVAASFSVYRDFVTTITGLLTLIIGGVGFATFFSYKKIREEEESVLCKMKDEQSNIEKLRKELEEMKRIEGETFSDSSKRIGKFERILQIKSLLNSESEKSSAIRAIEKANESDMSEHIFHQTKGDAYYFRGENGDYTIAIEEYKKAITYNETSAKAWFGLGQATYKSVIRTNDESPEIELDKNDVRKFMLRKERIEVSDHLKVKESIDFIKKSLSFDISAEAGIELGHMYNALGEYDMAMCAYKSVLLVSPSHYTCAFSYCRLWITKNCLDLKQGKFPTEELEHIVRLLKRIGLYGVYNNKDAYALLWYLYSIVPGLAEKTQIDAAYSATSCFTISNLFCLAE